MPGWLRPCLEGEAQHFSEIDLARCQLIRDLRHDLGVNDEGIPVVLDLIDQVHGLRRTLRSLLSTIDAQSDATRRRIIADIRAALGTDFAFQDWEDAMAKFGIGQAVRRVEDRRFLTGKGRYVDDIVLPGMVHGVNVLSPHAHARIKKVDVSKAKAAPGVLAVLTGADVAGDKLGGLTAHLMPEDFGAPKGHRTFLPLIVSDKVRHVGERVAFVVAETVDQARDAAELVQVDYEPLPAVVNIEEAVKEGAPKVHDDNQMGNTAFRLMFGNQEATDAAFAGARHVVKLRVENNRLSPVAMEPRVAIGDYDTANDYYTLYSASQNPHGVRMELSHVFHVPENQIRVISPDVGGGFGLKGNPLPDDLLVMWASRKLRRPVKWGASRSESMMNDPHGREMVYYGELALDDSGKILALRSRSLFQMGAWFIGAALAAGAFSIRFVPAAYDIQTMHLMSQGVFTNTSHSGPYRGAGRPEAAYFIERLIEHAASEIGIEPAEIRRRNLIPPSKLPYTTPTHWVYDSGEFVRLMDTCIAASDPRATPRAKANPRRTANCAAARSATTSSSAASSTTAWSCASIRPAR